MLWPNLLIFLPQIRKTKAQRKDATFPQNQTQWLRLLSFLSGALKPCPSGVIHRPKREEEIKVPPEERQATHSERDHSLEAPSLLSQAGGMVGVYFNGRSSSTALWSILGLETPGLGASIKGGPDTPYPDLPWAGQGTERQPAYHRGVNGPSSYSLPGTPDLSSASLWCQHRPCVHHRAPTPMMNGPESQPQGQGY